MFLPKRFENNRLFSDCHQLATEKSDAFTSQGIDKLLNGCPQMNAKNIL